MPYSDVGCALIDFCLSPPINMPHPFLQKKCLLWHLIRQNMRANINSKSFTYPVWQEIHSPFISTATCTENICILFKIYIFVAFPNDVKITSLVQFSYAAVVGAAFLCYLSTHTIGRCTNYPCKMGRAVISDPATWNWAQVEHKGEGVKLVSLTSESQWGRFCRERFL